MNANDLADRLEQFYTGTHIEKAAEVLRQQQVEIEYWKEKFNKAMVMQEVKPAKYTDEWWKKVEEFNKKLKEQEK
jgi:hypothetical protein